MNLFICNSIKSEKYLIKEFMMLSFSIIILLSLGEIIINKPDTSEDNKHNSCVSKRKKTINSRWTDKSNKQEFPD